MAELIRKGFKTEDWLAVWLGFLIIVLVLIGARPAIAFIGAQTFNVIWTLILAYLLFGGFIFQVPVIK